MTEILPNSLSKLAKEINEAHGKVQGSFKYTLEYAIFAGEKLENAKELLPHGNWLPWLKENIRFTQPTAHTYRNIAANKDLLMANYKKFYNLSIQGALKLIKKSPDDWWQKSDKHDWETPQWLFDILDEEFQFNLDVCANEDNAKCLNYFDEADNGLQQKWTGVCWMNPPYGRAIKDWMEKARTEADNGAIVVCLVPARTDPEWTWNYCRRSELRFLPGRLHFSNEGAAPFPSMIVVMRPTDTTISDLFWDVRAPDELD